MFTVIQAANHVTLYEGLPHQLFEPEKLERERREKATVTFGGYSFYCETLEASADDAEQLRALLGNESSFVPWEGPKLCGGFHPDYCVEWTVDRATYRYLICFNCHEVKVFGPDRTLRCDIEEQAYKQLWNLLRKRQKNRPTPAN